MWINQRRADRGRSGERMMTRTKLLLTVTALAGGLVLASPDARAHCDAIDGPVACAAVAALEAGNVNLVLPYAPAEVEPELERAFHQARIVRGQSAEAKVLADRYFMETAVRLHRAGEGAAYTGLKPAGMGFGPAIPATEKALASGEVGPVVALLTEEIATGVRARFAAAVAHGKAGKEPETAADVPEARARVEAELAFIGYVEALRQAAHGRGTPSEASSTRMKR
jgi:hypothetical protein